MNRASFVKQCISTIVALVEPHLHLQLTSRHSMLYTGGSISCTRSNSIDMNRFEDIWLDGRA